MTQPLHPNLAKLAAAYDEIFLRWTRGQIDAAEARMEILALQARDDDGILWSIDPESGAWLRRTLHGDLVPGTPPSYGLATPTPHDLSNNQKAFDPNNAVQMRKVEDELLHSPSALSGSTRRGGRRSIPQETAKIPSWVSVGVAVVAILLYVFLVR